MTPGRDERKQARTWFAVAAGHGSGVRAQWTSIRELRDTGSADLAALPFCFNGFGRGLFQHAVFAFCINSLGGSRFDLAAPAFRLDRLGSGIFTIRLRMNAEFMPVRFGNIYFVMTSSLFYVGERQGSVRIGGVDYLIKTHDGIAHVL